MEISELSITNFRNIGEKKTFVLNSRCTVVIGINGKGKSTLLNAVRIATGAYLLGIPIVSKRHILETEIRRVDFESHLAIQTPTIIEAHGSLDGIPLEKPWRRMIPKHKTKTTSSANDVGIIREKAFEKFHQINELGNIAIDNPVIAYFGTSRLHGNAKNTIPNYVGREVFKYGYYSWSDMKFASYQYVGWLRSFSYLAAENKEKEDNRQAFFNALRRANPYILDVDFDGQELRLRTKIGDVVSQYLPLSLHSDGMITHTSMVAELAFRCLVLNSHLGSQAIENSRGIVMIDEIDLHIHPTWQRHVLIDLKSAFPNLQFVATTHSPFIVQSLSANELINLDKLTDINPHELTIEEVAEDVMGVSSELSVQSEQAETHADQYLKAVDPAFDETASDEQLESLESQIADPGVRAFLKLQKLKSEHETNR